MAFGFKIRYTDVVCDNSLKNISANNEITGYSFDIRLGYYRGLFLSCIDRFELSVDGETVPAQDITFGINGKDLCVYQLSDCVSEFWSLIESAEIKVVKKGGFSAGEHKIAVILYLRVPYLPIPGEDGGRNYMPIDSCGEKILTLKEVL